MPKLPLSRKYIVFHEGALLFPTHFPLQTYQTTPRYVSRGVPDVNKIESACLDTRAERTVWKKEQAFGYCNAVSKPYHGKMSTSSCRFGDVVHNSKFILRVKLTFAEDGNDAIKLDVVDADVPLLIGLRVLNREKGLINILDDKLQDIARGYSITVTYETGHKLSSWNTNKV